MNIDDLQDYLSFCEHLNFTRAAEERELSQPALFSKIKALSRNLEALGIARAIDAHLALEGQPFKQAQFQA